LSFPRLSRRSHGEGGLAGIHFKSDTSHNGSPTKELGDDRKK